MGPVGLCYGLPWGVVYGFCLMIFLEWMIADHEVSDAFAEVSYLYTYVPEERVSGTILNDRDSLKVHPG